jgi:pyridoxal 5'-phosphate synthase pdxT subunit
MKIGVLALQGAFIEHIAVLEQLGIEAVPVRLPAELEGLDGLIIPGGESTTISVLMAEYGLDAKITALVKGGLPVLGTCAGMILLSADTQNSIKPLALIDITIRRNAFGRQRESFQAELTMAALGEKPFPAVFIRAPLIESSKDKVTVLARLPDGTAVAARQGKVLVTAFHPELTGDTRFHAYFRDIVAGRQ